MVNSKAALHLTQLQWSHNHGAQWTHRQAAYTKLVNMWLDMQCAVLLDLELQLQSAKHFQDTVHAVHLFIQLRLVDRLLLHLGLHCQLFELVLRLCVAAQL